MLYGEAEINATVDALEREEVPRVAVSLDELKRIELGERLFSVRDAHVPLDEIDKGVRTAKLNPKYPLFSPFGEWKVWYDKPPYEPGDNLFPRRRTNEEAYRAQNLAPWMAYITTAFLQDEPGDFLEYLRLLPCTRNNPWVEGVFYGENTPANRFKYADVLTGQEHSFSQGYPPLVMYPHTITDKGDLDFSLLIDRFIETVIYDSLGQVFTLLDITRTTDSKLLEWAYNRVKNRTPYIKSQVGEQSIVKVMREGSVLKTVPLSIHPVMQDMLRKAADDSLMPIKQNIDKLAKRTIEVKALEAQGIKAEFIGPTWLDPLTPAKISASEIASQMKVTHGTLQRSDYYLPKSVAAQYSFNDVPDPKPKGNLLLPLTGAAVAALGIYAATR